MANTKPSSADMIKATDRQRRALELRVAGKSLPEIAKELGYKDHSGARAAISAGLKKTIQEPADELRQIEAARLDVAIDAIWEGVRMGNLRVIDTLLKLMQRRAALFGIDAPAKTEGIFHHDYSHYSNSDIDREILAIIERRGTPTSVGSGDREALQMGREGES